MIRTGQNANNENDGRDDDEVKEVQEKRLLLRDAILFAQPFDVHAVQDRGDVQATVRLTVQ